jgi:hypothetical protein
MIQLAFSQLQTDIPVAQFNPFLIIQFGTQAIEFLLHQSVVLTLPLNTPK